MNADQIKSDPANTFIEAFSTKKILITKQTNLQAWRGIYAADVVASGFFKTNITESPLRNIFEINLSLLTGLAFFFPFPVLGSSVHISLTPSRTMLQCLSKALTLPSSFLLFLQLMRTCVLF